MKTFTSGIEYKGQNFRFKFDCPKRGTYTAPNFYGLEVAMRKNPEPLGWYDGWSLELFLEVDGRWFSRSVWQPTRAHCLEWLADLALVLRSGQTVYFDHSVLFEDGEKWAYQQLRNRITRKVDAKPYVWDGAKATRDAIKAVS